MNANQAVDESINQGARQQGPRSAPTLQISEGKALAALVATVRGSLPHPKCDGPGYVIAGGSAKLIAVGSAKVIAAGSPTLIARRTAAVRLARPN